MRKQLVMAETAYFYAFLLLRILSTLTKGQALLLDVHLSKSRRLEYSHSKLKERLLISYLSGSMEDDKIDQTKKRKAPDCDQWRQKCVAAFGLEPLPWANDRLTTLSQADNETWKRYYNFRMKIEKEDEIIEEDEDYDGSIQLLHECKDGLKHEVDRVGFEPWLQHTKQRIDDICWEDSDRDSIRSVTTSATIFAPYALPRALVLEHRYHFRPRSSFCEFYCYWHFRLVRFDGEPNGDTVQQRLALKYPKGWILMNPTYVADDEMEVLCSNGYKDNPRVQGRG
jgi:hypothetical protein